MKKLQEIERVPSSDLLKNGVKVARFGFGNKVDVHRPFSLISRAVLRLPYSTLVACLLMLVLLIETVIGPAAHTSTDSSVLRSKTLRERNPTAHSPRKRSDRAQEVTTQSVSIEAAVVRHAPTINARIQGSVRQLLAEDVTLNSNAII